MRGCVVIIQQKFRKFEFFYCAQYKIQIFRIFSWWLERNLSLFLFCYYFKMKTNFQIKRKNVFHLFFVLECCLFVFLDGSAYYFDEFMRKVTGFYRVMYGSVNGHPHYVARNCRKPDEYGSSCTYIWYSG